MNRIGLISALAGVVAGVGASGCAQQTSRRVNIDPQASQALHRMSDTLAKARSFSFQGATTMDEPLPTGQMGQFSRQVHVLVHRPDKVYVRTQQGDDIWVLWYHSTNLTLLDTAGKTYACLKVPSRIDSMVDDVATRHGLTLPLADLLSSDLYEDITTGVLVGKYIGQAQMEGVQTDQLLFTHDALDWQIWIQTGPQPVPRKILIDYKRLPGRPQFAAVLSEWNLSAPATDEQFVPDVPKDAKQVGMTTLLHEAEGA